MNCSECNGPSCVEFQTEDGTDYASCSLHVIAVLRLINNEYGEGNWVVVTLMEV